MRIGAHRPVVAKHKVRSSRHPFGLVSHRVGVVIGGQHVRLDELVAIHEDLPRDDLHQITGYADDSLHHEVVMAWTLTAKYNDVAALRAAPVAALVGQAIHHEQLSRVKGRHHARAVNEHYAARKHQSDDEQRGQRDESGARRKPRPARPIRRWCVHHLRL
jgi:hypothetical protein